jgi:mitotic spindle assembly checkpoint protein MAD2
LEKGHVQKLIVVVTGVDTKDVLERWVFNVETDKGTLEGTRYASLCRQFKGLA